MISSVVFNFKIHRRRYSKEIYKNESVKIAGLLLAEKIFSIIAIKLPYIFYSQNPKEFYFITKFH